MQRRFVILTLQRSGSNMLVSLLKAHPEITCLGELKRATPTKMRTQGYRGALKALEHVDPRFQADSVRFADPHTFIDDVMAKLAPPPITGFKLMLTQHPRFMSELIAGTKYAKIFLYRANHLASYSSQKIVKITGQGSARAGRPVKQAKAHFRKREFRSFLKTREQQFEDVRRQLMASGQDYLEIEYLKLVDGDGVSQVVKFLGADPSYELEPKTAKRNPGNLLERFDNPEDVQKELVRIGAEHWAIEQLSVPAAGGSTAADESTRI